MIFYFNKMLVFHESVLCIWASFFKCNAKEKNRTRAVEIQNFNSGQMLLVSLNFYICTVFILVYCLYFIYCGAGSGVIIDF
jgi:hypothetical protein